MVRRAERNRERDRGRGVQKREKKGRDSEGGEENDLSRVNLTQLDRSPPAEREGRPGTEGNPLLFS